MPQLWILVADTVEWTPQLLAADTMPLPDNQGVLIHTAIEQGDAWVLVAPPDTVRVNGAPLSLGLRVLRDKDEICAGRERMFFSAERLAEIEPFDGPEAVPCARCRQPIAPGTASVRCPGCGVVCHETPELNCMTYSDTCPLCSRPSALKAFTWTPEEVEA